jgi:hypothetical protein
MLDVLLDEARNLPAAAALDEVISACEGLTISLQPGALRSTVTGPGGSSE